MNRRMIILRTVLVAALTTLGCRRRPEPDADEQQFRPREFVSQDPTPINPVLRLKQRLESYAQSDVARFDPLTITILSTLISGIIRYCIAQTALRIQRQVQRKPDGATATRLKQKFREHFRDAQTKSSEKLFVDDAGLDEHVAITMKAFAEATPNDLTSLISDLKDELKANPRLGNTAQFNLAGEWSRIDVQ